VALMAVLLVALFVAERAHQWQSLLSRDWSLRWDGKEIPRRAVLLTALAIGWGEGLGFYVQGERAFWGMIFWVYAAHAVLTAWQTLPRIAASCATLASLAALLACGGLDRNWPVAWTGFSLIPWRIEAPEPAAVLVLVAAHGIPCFVLNLRRMPARVSATAVGVALLEWFLVAKSVWFPPGSLFPDLTDWWNLGSGSGFLVHPLWMAPFLAHVVVDAIRYARPRPGTAA
jgi:hypothetical protein